MPRPSDYTPEIAKLICDLIAEGQSLRKITSIGEFEVDGVKITLPHRATIHEWIADNREGFGDQYARAKELSGDVYLDKITSTADQLMDGGIDPGAARVAVDAWKWTAARMAPKQYGDRQIHTGDKDNPIQVQVIKPDLDA